jgi:hypothetical protein
MGYESLGALAGAFEPNAGFTALRASSSKAENESFLPFTFQGERQE